MRAWSHWARNAGVSCWGWWQMPGRGAPEWGRFPNKPKFTSLVMGGRAEREREREGILEVARLLRRER